MFEYKLYQSKISGSCTMLVLCILVYFAQVLPVTKSQREVTILDTTKQKGLLNWTRIPYTDDAMMGWWPSSMTTTDGGTVNVYQTCSIARPQSEVNNWLITPFIRRNDARVIHVELNFTIRDCSVYEGQAQLGQCRETFKLMYSESQSDKPVPIEQFQEISPILAASKKWESAARGPFDWSAYLNSETRQFDASQNGFRLAFKDNGACLMLFSVRIFYKFCPSRTQGFSFFARRPITSQSGDVIEGKCVRNAVRSPLGPPKAICQTNTEWLFVGSDCLCNKGHRQSDFDGTGCIACSKGSFKAVVGNGACQKCPSNSHTPHSGADKCRCDNGFFRAPSDSPESSCTQPPAAVQHLRLESLQETSAILSWRRPNYLGGRSDLTYRIECRNCHGNVQFLPSKSGFNQTRVEIRKLLAQNSYHISVIAENGVSAASGTIRSASINFTTNDAKPQPVNNVRAVKVGKTFIFVAWDKPVPDHVPIEMYEVQYYPHDNSDKHPNISTIATVKENTRIERLREKTEYRVSVRGKTSRGWGKFSSPLPVVTGNQVATASPITKKDVSPMNIALISAIIVFICLFIVILVLVLYCRRTKNQCGTKQNGSEYDGVLPYSPGYKNGTEGNQTIDIAGVYRYKAPTPVVAYNNNTHFLPAFTQYPVEKPKQYVDPHTYEDPNEAVKVFTREILPDWITIESVIGGGEFGNVCKGYLRPPGLGEAKVAIKMLKADATDKNRVDFLTEASIMGQFDHINVIYLQGVVTKSHPNMIVTEYMENGSLDVYLREHDSELTSLQLVGVLRGIACGMQYLSGMGYVHRDLAARNILVGENLVCKVSDFGLSRVLRGGDNPENPSDGAYTTKGGKIPVRWTAPEAISYRKFTSSSDVWSYGVLTWEVVSFGEHPYYDWSNQAVIQAVDRGYRLPPPMACPAALYQLMSQCWQKERNDRPKFGDIVRQLERLIRNPDQLQLVEPPMAPLVPLNVNPFMSVASWLASFNMEHYASFFHGHNCTTLYQISQMTPQDLQTIGIADLSHQQTIARNIQLLRKYQLANSDTASSSTVVTQSANVAAIRDSFLV